MGDEARTSPRQPAAPPLRAGFARTDDGLQLYYRIVGAGGPTLVCCNGVGVSTFFFRYIAEHFRDGHTVVLWDYRGHGRSGLPADVETADLSIERNARDLHCVLEAAGVTEPAILLGHSMGCQVILQYTQHHPDRVRGLVPMFGTYARPLDTFMDSPHARKVFNLIHKLAALGGKSSTRMLLPLYASPLAFDVGRITGVIDRHYAERADIDKYMEHLIHMDPRVFLRMVSLMADHDLEAFLPDVTAPTLVIAGEKDLFTPVHRSERMAELIPGAELMILADGSHAAIVEYPDTINHRIERFITERCAPARSVARPA